MKIARKPLYFGPAERPLFGWLHAREDGMRGDLVAVICQPFGHEYVSAHRSMRRLADRLAEAGVPALRFDYDGTGDSAGRDEEPNRVGAWLQSIREAMRVARETTGCERIGLVGVRLGALLAAKIADEADVDSLVLWWPVVRGRSYAREMKALHLTSAHAQASGDGAIEPGGFVMTAETQQAIGALTIDAPRARRVLVVTRGDLDEQAPFDGVEQLATDGFMEMTAAPHSTVVPVKAIEGIAGWFAREVVLRGWEAPHPALRAALSRGERAIEFSGFFGILSEGAADAPLVLLCNAGATPHVGPNRLYVLLARALSEAGLASLRFDLPGLGDSFIDDPEKENDAYPEDVSGVIAAAMRAVPWRSYVLMGLCSGAHASFHAALDLPDAPVAECIAINPLTFYYERGMALDPPATGTREWQWYMRSMRRRDRWAKLLRGNVRFRVIARAVGHRILNILRLRRAAARGDLERDVRRIVDSGRRLTFVFSRFAAGIDLLMSNAGRTVARLQKRGAIDLWQIPDANHTFESRRAREAMIASVVAHLTRRYRSTAGRHSAARSASS